MGRAIQVIGGRVTNPGATITALTPNTGDSFTVKSIAPATGRIILDQAWVQEAALGVLRVRSSRLHDNAQGIRLRPMVSGRPLLPYEAIQVLEPQDSLTVELSGGAAEVDAAFLQVIYEDISGLDGHFGTWEEVSARMVNLVGNEIAITTGATASDWGGASALNKTFDTLKRNVQYAVLGYLCDTAIGAIGLTGPDTGNTRVGCPGSLEPIIMGDWFVENAKQHASPMIPIINAANVANTLVDVSHTGTGVSINLTVVLAELAGA